MKVFVFTDVHITPIKGLNLFVETSLSCINNILDIADEEGVKDIWFLGDLLYLKTYVEAYLFPKSYPTFKRLAKFNTKFIVGNHDVASDQSNTEHNLLIIFEDYIDIVKDPYETIEIDGNHFTFVNYNSNFYIAEKKLPKFETGKSMLLCHMDCNGFFTNAKHVQEQSKINISDLKQFDLVFSGHYHKRSKIDNIQYIGSTHHMRRSDVGNPFGFVELDTKTFKYKFRDYKNYTPPCYVDYKLSEINKLKKTTNSFIKIIISPEESDIVSQNNLDDLQKMLYKNGNHHIIFDKIKRVDIETGDGHIDSDVPDAVNFTTDHDSFFGSYVNNIKTELDKDRLLNIILKKTKL